MGRSCMRALPVMIVVPSAWPAMEIRNRSGVPAPPTKMSSLGARIGLPVGVTRMRAVAWSMSQVT